MGQSAIDLDEIFAGALDRADLGSRGRYLDHACRGDAALRRRVEALLRAHEQAGAFLEAPAALRGTEPTAADAGPAPRAAQLRATVADGTTAYVTRDDRTVTAGPPAAGAGPSAPPRGTAVHYFGDYEVTRELGRGGMGVVFEARQVSLNRAVALKMIRAGLLASDLDLRRFQNEAEAVARLDHPGIVPVYEVGEHDGQRYFSMKLVPGGCLADRLAEFVDESRRAASLVVEVAEAVHHAHMRGILHRDLKPANILVDAEGHAHVTDFGLARSVDASAEITASGAILGTPAYMAPEQAAGRRAAITTATDVYGLGSVLYALLTGRAPFAGDSLADTLQLVREQWPEPPRRLNGRVPRDLEVACLKCLEKDPRRRYSSAQALADDLRAWLDSRPIAARPVGPLTRAALWCRRRPAVAALTGAVAAALVVGVAAVIGVLLWSNRRLERSLERETLAREATEAAREGSDRRFELARLAVESYYTGVSEDVILKRPELRDLRARLLRNALSFYQQMADDLQQGQDTGPATDGYAVRGLARAVERVADIQQQVGDKPAALESLGRAAAIYAAAPPIVVSSADTAQLWLKIGRLQRQMGRPADALQSVAKALTILGEPEPGRDISLVYDNFARMNLGGVLLDLGRPEDAARILGATRSYYEDRLRRYPQIANGWGDLASCYQWLGYAYAESGRPAEALDCHRLELAGQQEYRPTGSPNEGNPAARLGQCHLDMAFDLTDLGRLDEARSEIGRALAILDEQAAAKAVDADVQSELARACYVQARLQARAVEAEAADASARRAESLIDGLDDPSPNDRYRRAALRAIRAGLPGNTPEARAELAAAAVAALRQSLDAGFMKAHLLRSDPDLEPIRDLPDFQQLLQRLDARLREIAPAADSLTNPGDDTGASPQRTPLSRNSRSAHSAQGPSSGGSGSAR